MDVTLRIKGQDRAVAVEAAYLLARYLSHRLTKEKFLRQLKVDVKTPDQQKARELVLEIVADIEDAERMDIAHLTPQRRASYAEQVEELLSGISDSQIEHARVLDALLDLRMPEMGKGTPP